MRHYFGSGSALDNKVTSKPTLMTLVGSATVRPRIYEVILGSAVAPVDQASRYLIQRCTAMGTLTGTNVGGPTDSTDPASSATSTPAPVTTEPTYTSNVSILQFPLHQRPTFRWLAYDMERALLLPASTTAGVGLTANSTTVSFVVDPGWYWAE